MEGLSLPSSSATLPVRRSCCNSTPSASPKKNLFFFRGHYENNRPNLVSVLRKRDFNILVLLGLFSSPLSSSSAMGVTIDDEKEEKQQWVLQRYVDTKEGFTLLVPSSFNKVEKSGATALFEEVNKGSNNVGVVVVPVRLNSLSDFGNPQFVLDKLIQAEKRKESTKETEVIGAAERLGNGGIQVYEFEYRLDSTRGGMKRIFSAAFVDSKKLYLLNIAYADRPENPLETNTRMVLEQVLHSFDTASSL
ncbi:hypothetical protein GIB67_031934 [Kingdonia uniflora]|uniref:PsbP C-terminal domain-containing protein n=1 Tax=Kingdonia uniflora TaxID=39325 RepID=A0A7J7NTJ7_9MAGN|nr:hypothetical protein GIB67_031934 [Kingdonia uniflora]